MIIANILGLTSFLFLFWKRLKEDYHFEKIFTLALYVLTGLLISFFISKYFFPPVWFWVELLGSVIGFLLGIWKLKMKLFEGLEPLIIGFLIWISLVFLADSVSNSSLSSFLAFWVSIIFVFLFFFFNSFYKRFSWYKSGRVGFSGLMVSGLFFATRSVVALLNINVISLSGRLEGIVSGIVSLFSFLLLFNLSRKK